MKKRILTSALAATMLFAAASAGTAFARTKYENRNLTNGDFEQGMTGWGTTWQTGTGTVTIASEGGSNVLHMKTDTGRCYVSQSIANVTEGDRLTLSFRMKVPSLGADNGCAEISIGYRDKSGEYITQGNYPYYEVTGDKWVYKGIDLLIPPNTGSMSLMVRLYNGGEVYYDDIEITDFDNQTTLTVTKGELELDSIPKGVGTVTANLHYVPEYTDESGNLIFAAYENQKLIGMDIRPFTASGAVYTKADVAIPPEAENVAVRAYVWKNGETVSPIAHSLTLPREGRSNVFDRYAAEKMRGVYDAVGCFYRAERMQKLEDSGVNTFIFNIIGNFHGGDINKTPAALDAVCADMEKYVEETGNQIFLKASYGANSVVNNDKFGAFHPGTEHQLTLPCPLAEQYWEEEMLSRLEVVARHPKLIGVVFDMEMYSGGRTSYPGACLCDTCVKKYVQKHSDQELLFTVAKERKQYLQDKLAYNDYKEWFAGEVSVLTAKMRERLHAINPNLIIGIMPQMEWLGGIEKGLGTKKMPVVIFEERTYKGAVGIADYAMAQAKLKDLPVIFAVGLWPNEEYAIKKPAFAAKIEAAEPRGLGYWIYSATEMDKAPAYYDELKKANDKIIEKNQPNK